MGRLSNIFALLLIAAVAGNALVTVSPMAAAELPAPCHEHGNKMPSPHPDDLQCCQAGHSAAVVQAIYSNHPNLLRIADSTPDKTLPIPTAADAVNILTTSSGPPGALALRI